MGPSERVTIIQEIARRLAPEEWSVIDLTLKQFEFPWTNQWQGEKKPYVIAMLEDGSDEKLLALAEHLGFELHPDRPIVEPSFWRHDYLRLFITHLATHKVYAGTLQKRSFQHGICGFVAHKDIEPTKEWQDEILLALRTADALVALLHPGFHNSKWTDQEIGVAMGRSIPVVSVSLGETPYGFIGRQQAANGINKDEDTIARELANIFCRHKQTRKRMAIATVRRFEESDSFAEAKANMASVEKLKYWDSRLQSRVRKAVKKNGQIEGSWGVPQQVETLLKKWASVPDTP